jgi:hypothetical protein
MRSVTAERSLHFMGFILLRHQSTNCHFLGNSQALSVPYTDFLGPSRSPIIPVTRTAHHYDNLVSYALHSAPCKTRTGSAGQTIPDSAPAGHRKRAKSSPEASRYSHLRHFAGGIKMTMAHRDLERGGRGRALHAKMLKETTRMEKEMRCIVVR